MELNIQLAYSPKKIELLMKGDYCTHTRNYRIDNNVFLRGRDQIMF